MAGSPADKRTKTELSDHELIELSLAEPEAFAVLFHRHFEAMYRYVYRRTGPDAAEDVTQEIFARAFHSRKDKQASPTALPWLYSIASNLIVDHYRAHSRVTSPAPSPAAEEAVSEEDAVHSRVDAAAEHPRVARALEQLDPDDREPLLLFALADLSYEEISQALSIPIGTVRSRLARARRVVSHQLAHPREVDRDA